MLRRKYFLLLSFLSIAWVSKAQFIEDFSDGDFSNNPAWVGDNTSWQVSAGMLRSNGPAVTPTILQLATSSTTATNCQFEFFCNLKFATSSVNYADIFLISDSVNLKNNCSGFFVRIGGTNDEVCLYRKDLGSGTKIIDGLDGRVASSTNNLLKVKVTRSSANLWTLMVDISGTGNSFVVEGTYTDPAYPSSKFFGILSRYSSANNQNFYFDNFYVGPILVDNDPPQLDTVFAESSNSLKLIFNEAVEGLSSEDINNYLLQPGAEKPVVCSRDLTDQRVVRLEFSSSFISGTTYTINGSNIKDLNNNILISASKTFVFSEALFKDIVINEIMADPSPQVGLPDREWIEIFNRSNKSIQLSGFKISDGSSTAIFGNYLLKPDSFLIICATNAASDLLSFGSVLSLASFPSLNNSSDNVILYSASGKLIDKVDYTDNWYNNSIKALGGYTLELINPHHPCGDSRNWRANNSSLGGTPGMVNSIFDASPDVAKPKLKSLLVLNASQVQVVFDERMDSLSLINSLINIGNGISVVTRQVIGLSSDTLVLNVSPSFTLNTKYSIQIKYVSDCWGNLDTTISDSFQYVISVSPTQFQLIFTEIMADPDPPIGLPAHEFVEIYNASNQYLSLSDIEISTTTASASLPNFILAPDSFLILCATSVSSLFSQFGNVAGVPGFPTLANTGMKLYLKTKTGFIIHTLEYSDQWYQSTVKRNGGWSLELVDPTNPCEEKGNWKESIHPKGGTPGQKNSVHANVSNTSPPSIFNVFPINKNSLMVYFSESIDSFVSLKNNNFIVNNGIGNPTSVRFGGGDMKSVILSFADTFKVATKYSLTCDSIADCKGNFSEQESISFGLVQVAQKGDVVINEVLSNPKPNGGDFVELYNNSDKYLNLADINFFEYDIVSGQMVNVLPIHATNRLFNPGEFIALCENPTDISKHYARYQNILEVGSLPSLPDDTGVVVIGTTLGTSIDSMNYSEKMHYALIDDFNGVSLERISYDRPSVEFTNWQSATSVSGFATPGFTNSKFTPKGNGLEFLSISPQVFSPDDDGYNDLINFSFALPANNYTVSVTIYDIEGRTIKKLVQSQTVSAEGIFSWNGIQDDNNKAPIGIYFVLFEAFNPLGEVKASKKSFALASKF